MAGRLSAAPTRIALPPFACLLAIALAACGFDEGGESRGKRIPASLTWLSTSLKQPAAAKSGGAEIHALPDTGDLFLSYRLTPTNMEGRLIQVGLMIGASGPGGASRLGLMGSEEGYSRKDVPDSKSFPLFNMSERPTFASDFLCCWASYPDDDRAYSAWFEIMFAYVDVSFSIASGALAGAHTIRLSLANIGDLGYRRGDLLYKAASGFHWVDSAGGTPSSTRPGNPLQLNWIADYAGSGDGRGNQHIPTLFIAIQDSQRVHLPADTVLANAWEFVADFILTRGLIFRRKDPAAMTSPAELLAAFDIRADRDNTAPGADGLSSNFYALRTPLDRPRPNDFKDSLGNWVLPPPDSANLAL